MRRRDFLVGSALLAAGCGTNAGGSGEAAPTGGGGRFTVVATTGMVADIARHVAGEHADVDGLLGETVDPHIYQPNRGDMQRLKKADLVLYSGLLLEGKFGEAFEQLKSAGKPVVAVTEEIEKSYLRFPEEFEGHPDPHVWMDVQAWSRCVDVVVKHLAPLLPDHDESIRANAKTYQELLAKTDAYARKVIESIPEERRVLVTAHDAFGYFARAYGLEVKSPQGITTESSPGVNDINALVDYLVAKKITAIFIESSVSQENLMAVIEGAKQKGHAVRVEGPLYSDAMGPAGTYTGSYVGMIDHNATLIARSLGGEAPEAGMQGKLKPKAESKTS